MGEKTAHRVMKNNTSYFNVSAWSSIQFMRENFQLSSKSVDSGKENTQEDHL